MWQRRKYKIYSSYALKHRECTSYFPLISKRLLNCIQLEYIFLTFLYIISYNTMNIIPSLGLPWAYCEKLHLFIYLHTIKRPSRYLVIPDSLDHSSSDYQNIAICITSSIWKILWHIAFHIRPTLHEEKKRTCTNQNKNLFSKPHIHTKKHNHAHKHTHIAQYYL